MENKDSHRQILKSAGIVGGSQVISLAIGIMRTKVAAILLGPSGIGILGILQTATDLVRSATGFGINFSGVRDIAEASSSGNQLRIDRTITILRRWALWTGILGMVCTVIFCIPLSNYSFGDDSYSLSIAILSVTLLISSVSSGQMALLQGLRRIKQMAISALAGALLGIVITLPLYYWLGKAGIVPGMIMTALGALFVSWYFSRKIKIIVPELTIKDTLKGGLTMAKLGFFIVISGFIASGTMLITRAFIVKKLDLDAVGQFQASWMISRTYIGIVLNAMLADFFPRLSAINKDNKASNTLINEQLEITLIVGIPMVITLCAFANIVILILYSSSFTDSVFLLQWNMYGSFITLISWPLGVMFIAKNKGMYSIVSDSLWSVVFVSFIYLGWNTLGFKVLGVAYLAASFVSMLSILYIVRNIGQFSFSSINKKYILYGLISILAIFLNVFFITGIIQYIISSVIIVISCIYSWNKLKSIINIKEFILSRFFNSKPQI